MGGSAVIVQKVMARSGITNGPSRVTPSVPAGGLVGKEEAVQGEGAGAVLEKI